MFRYIGKQKFLVMQDHPKVGATVASRKEIEVTVMLYHFYPDPFERTISGNTVNVTCSGLHSSDNSLF